MDKKMQDEIKSTRAFYASLGNELSSRIREIDRLLTYDQGKETELNRCLHCGTIPEVHENEDDPYPSYNQRLRYCIKCPKCGITTGARPDMQEVIKTWNSVAE